MTDASPRARAFRGSPLLTFGPLAVALVAEVSLFEFIGRSQGNPGFASIGTLILVLNQSAVFGVAAVGVTFIILTAGIDLSIGSLFACAGVLCALVVNYGLGGVDDPSTTALILWLTAGGLAGLLLGALVGAVSGGLITLFRIPPFIATLALMSTLRGLGNLATDGKPVAPLPAEYSLLGRYQIGGRVPVSMLIFLAVLIAGAILLNQTRFGRYVRAIGGNEESARLSGVPIKKVTFLVYVWSGALTALGGLILSSRLGAGSPKVGVGDELAVIAAVVVGGTSLAGGRGTITGTFAGLLVVAVLNTGLTWIGVETFGQQVTLGLVILGAVLLDRLKNRA